VTAFRIDANIANEPAGRASTVAVSDSAKRQIGTRALETKAHGGRGPAFSDAAFSDAAFSDAAFSDSPRFKR
jgi:hypothetical protein